MSARQQSQPADATAIYQNVMLTSLRHSDLCRQEINQLRETVEKLREELRVLRDSVGGVRK